MITKRDVKNAGRCPRLAWLSRHSPRPLDSVARARIEVGTRVGELGRLLFPGGVLVNGDGLPALDSGAPALFEAAFQAGDMRTRVDVLARDGDGWRLIEFKSSKQAGPAQLEDVFVQAHILRAAGGNLTDVCLGLVNGEYVFDGETLDPEQFFVISSVLDKEPEYATLIAKQAAVARAALDTPGGPDPIWDRPCYRPELCDYLGDCHPVLPEPTLFSIPNLHHSKRTRFMEMGIRGVKEIEDGSLLTDNQRRYWQMVRSGETWINPSLPTALQSIRYPAAFIDFEAFNPTIPAYTGTSPMQSIPFQWSAHVMQSADEVSHFEFLADGTEDPRAAFCRSLLEVLGSAECAVFYSNYEISQTAKLAEEGFAGAKECEEILRTKGVDLERIIKGNVQHPKFDGKSSIKKVLPALVPELGYDDLVVKNGSECMAEFERQLDRGIPSDERDAIRRALLEYCKRDTYAMVVLFQALQKLAG